MTLSDLTPGDVAVFVWADGDGEQFVVLGQHPTYEATLIHKVTNHSPYWTDGHGKIVRRRGRGRIEPPRIVMESDDAGQPAADIVAAETGLTPRRLATDRAKLLAALKGLRSEIVRNLCASYEPDMVVGTSEIVQADAAIAEVEVAS